MDVEEKYTVYHLAYQLTQKDYQLLYINDQTNEIWLEKKNRKENFVVRIVHKGFVWKNHLKTDIAKVFQRIETLKHIFTGKEIDIYNVYIAEKEPVEEWEDLKASMVLKGSKVVRMHVFYFAETNYQHEHARFFNTVAIEEPSTVDTSIEPMSENTITKYQQYFHQLLENKIRNVKKVFTFGKPRFVYLLLVINLCMFIWLEYSGGSTNIQNLIQHGAIYNPAIMDGEWWRLFSAMFVHIGWIHLAVNMLALYYVGIIIEKIFGSIRFITIYLVAGIGGSLVNFVFNPYLSAGASGALFGLFGALLYFAIIYRKAFMQAIGKNFVIILLMNLMVALLVPQIDLGAHLSGLLFGFLAAMMTSLPYKRLILLQSLGLVSCVFLFMAILIYGV